jgi:putative ABC transport system permease protein
VVRVILVSLRDLQFRRRRFAIAILGTALVLGITLVLSGMVAGFGNEAQRTVDSFHAEGWVVPAGATGAFLSSATFEAGVADEVTRLSGAPAVPIAILHTSVDIDGTSTQINVHGVPVGSFAEPPLVAGRQPAARGEVVVDDSLGPEVGEDLDLNGRTYAVVGRTHGLTYQAHLATVSMTLPDAQALGYGGAPLATAVVTSAPLPDPPAGTLLLSGKAIRKDMVAPLQGPIQAITTMQWLMWMLSTMIVGSAVYLSALDRVRDFAVFKAMGANDRSVLSGLLTQSAIICAVAFVVGIGVAFVIAPILPIPSEVPRFAYYGLAVIAAVVAVLSSVAGSRRALAVDPALAFGGA